MDSDTPAQRTAGRLPDRYAVEVIVISEHTHNVIGSPPLSPPLRSLRGPSNHILPVAGHFSGTMKLGTHETHQDVYVVKRLHQQLLGRPAIEALGVVVRAWAICTVQGPMAEFPQLFKGLGKLNHPYSIKLQPEATPFSQCVVRRVAIPLIQPVKEELERMERLGVIASVSDEQILAPSCGCHTTPQGTARARRRVALGRPAGNCIQQHQEYAHISSSLGIV